MSLKTIFNFFYIINSFLLFTILSFPNKNPLIFEYEYRFFGYKLEMSQFNGKSPQPLVINLSKNYSYLKDTLPSQTQTSLTTCHGSYVIPINDIEINKLEAYLCNGPIIIGDESRKRQLNNINYFMVSNAYLMTIHNEYFVGLSPNVKNETFSIVHSLYNQGYISSKKFGFSPRNNSGLLYIGGVPSNETHNKHLLKCNNINEKSWGCKLNTISINNYTFINDAYTYFNVNDKKTYVSLEFFFFFGENILNKYIKTQQCSMKIRGDNCFFECELDIFNYENYEISFGFFDGNGFSFDLINMFTCRQSICETLFFYNDKMKNFFVLGGHFLSMFVSEFDYEENTISFYYDGIIKERKLLNYNENRNIISIKKICFGMFVALSLMSMLFIYKYILTSLKF